MTDPTFLGPPTVTVQQLAEHLQISPQTVWAHVREGEWPHVKFGPRTIRFTPEHVGQIMTLSTVEPTPAADPVPRRGRRRITS